MKKSLVLIAIIALMLPLPNLYSQFEKVKGGFKSCTTYKYLSKSGKIDSTSKHRILYSKYDSYGNLIEETSFMSNDSIENKKTYGIDDSGNHSSSIFYDNHDSIISKVEYKYNKNKYLIEQISYSPKDPVFTKSLFIYNERGQKIEENLYYSDMSFRFKIITKYDKNGNIIEMKNIGFVGLNPLPCNTTNSKNAYLDDTKYKLIDSNTEITNYKYDKNNNIKEEIRLNALKMIRSKKINEYNSKGQLTVNTEFDSIGKVKYKSVYKYDKIGNIIEEAQYNSDGKVLCVDTFAYDEFCNKLEEIHYYDFNIPASRLEYVYEK